MFLMQPISPVSMYLLSAVDFHVMQRVSVSKWANQTWKQQPFEIRPAKTQSAHSPTKHCIWLITENMP